MRWDAFFPEILEQTAGCPIGKAERYTRVAALVRISGTAARNP